MSVSLPLMVSDGQSAAQNYFDCTESNGEDDDDDDEEEEDEKGKGDEESKECQTCSVKAPKWEDFFTTETLTDSQNSLNSQSRSCCSVSTTSPSRATGSQTPELFSDEEETPDIDNFSLTLSASLSNHSSQNMDSHLPDTLILRPERGGQEQGGAEPQNNGGDGAAVQSELEELSASQASSDFDIPCTPESKVPRPDELLQLYRKLASGEEEVIRKGSQGSV